MKKKRKVRKIKMSNLDKEWKSEVNEEIQKADYIGKRIGVRVVIGIAIIVVITAIGSMGYKKWVVDKNREIFKKSVTYTESAASFLADSYKQYNEAETEVDKKAIMEYVSMRYPNLDYTQIENEELREFYSECIAGK